MDNNDVIRGRRLTKQESDLLNYPDLPLIDESVLDKVLAPFINTDKIKFKNGNQIVYASSTYENCRGNRSKLIGMQCYDTETCQWVFMELDITQPIDRYIPEHMFVEWLMRNEG